MSFLLRIGFCLVFFIALAVPANLHGQIVYTITGFANNSPFDDPTLAPEVGPGESYVAEFVIDDSVLDSDPDSDVGVYSGAILFSSITFSGGYVSQVDFAGGTVEVRMDFGGGGFFLIPANNSPEGLPFAPLSLGGIIVADPGNALDSDALLTEPGAQLDGSPLSVYFLQEPTGVIYSFSDESDLGLGEPTTGPIRLTVTVGTVDSTLLGDVNLDGVFDFFDIQPFIDLLMAGEFQAEGDINENGFVDFFDIQPFIAALGRSCCRIDDQS